MLIRRRLILSNFVMFLVPFFVILGIAGGFYLNFHEYRLSEMGNLDSDKQIVHQVEAEMRLYANQLKAAPNQEKFNVIAQELMEHLSIYNYHLMIMREDKSVVMSNCDELDIQQLDEENNPVVFADNSIICIFRGSNRVVSMIEKNGERYHIISVMSRNLSEIEKNLLYFYRSYTGILVFCGILIIWLVNTMLTKKLAKKINEPLAQLRHGAKKIQSGDLAFEIQCNSDEEFNQVCSDFNEMRRRLKISEEAEKKYAEDRNILIAGISHDIRTPLTVIKGYVEGLRDGIADTPEKRQKYLDIIYNRTCDMDQLVDKLFLFSKLNMGKYPFNFKNVDISEYMQLFYKKVKDEFANRKLELKLEQRCTNLVQVKLDGEELNRVLINILANCSKYRVRTLVKVNMVLYQEGNEVVLEISDDGDGVAEHEVEQIFSGFYRGDSSRSNSASGSGLGLAIAEKIVLAHGGRIYAENHAGLHIYIRLPIQ